ncbi:hypothetical protein [Paenibacillus senegalensis]|uniref:hypothetical protein n=1 Tax=Paenibacillus senegalensis TaxID=1465766 RepID=UPI00028A003B|nr:hypothetical protein [Paenibacillus senegalensis]
MYQFGQPLTRDQHFKDHYEHQVPVQIYMGEQHQDIGYVQSYSSRFIKINGTFYSRSLYTFISRPGY